MEISLFTEPMSSSEYLDFMSAVTPLDDGYRCSKFFDFELRGVCDWRRGGRNAVAFCSNLDLELAETRLQNCIVITEELPQAQSTNNIYVSVHDARAAFIDLLVAISQGTGIRPHTSIMAAHSKVSPNANISPGAIIESGVDIADGVTIAYGCVIKAGTQIGKNTIVRENTVVGCNGITIYKSKDGRILKFPHVCGVIIGEGTEIGAGCVIPKGILTSTYIGSNVVVGNLCNIGHGATLMDGVWISVGALIGGHTYIGEEATLGMGVCIRDNLQVGERASIGMGSVVVKSLEPQISVFGNPAKRIPSFFAGPKR